MVAEICSPGRESPPAQEEVVDDWNRYDGEGNLDEVMAGLEEGGSTE